MKYVYLAAYSIMLVPWVFALEGRAAARTPEKQPSIWILAGWSAALVAAAVVLGTFTSWGYLVSILVMTGVVTVMAVRRAKRLR